MPVDLSRWLNDEQARAALDVSARTLDRMTKDGLTFAHRTRQGKRPERCFDPDVIRAHLKPAPVSTLPPETMALAPVSSPMTGMAQSQAPEITWPAIIQMVQQIVTSQAPVMQKVYVPVKEASAITGLSRKFLRRLIESGALPGIRDVSIKVKRADLEELDVTAQLLSAPKGAKKGKVRR